MDFANLDQSDESSAESLISLIDSRLKTADLLVLGRDDVHKRSVISDLLDKDERIRVLKSVLLSSRLRNMLSIRRRLELQTPYSRTSVIGGIKFNLSNFGELQTACRLWKDYCAKRDAVVYVVNASTGRNVSEAREDLNNLLTDEDFKKVPFLIICTNADCSASDEELCTLLGLTNMTTGKGRVNLAGRNVRALEVFVARLLPIWYSEDFVADRFARRFAVAYQLRHLDAIKWLSQYIE